MEGSTGFMGQESDRDATRRHLDAARAALRSLEDLAAPDGATLSGQIVARHLGVAMNELIGVDQQISAAVHAMPDAPRVACSFCGNMIMPTATICGFCWRRPADPVAARSGLEA